MNHSPSEPYLLSADKFKLPDAIDQCPGLQFKNHKVQSVLLSTDLGYLHKLNTDCTLVIHPFEPSLKINRTVLEFDNKPVLCGVGGGLRKKENTIELIHDAEKRGASGIVITRPTPPKEVEIISEKASVKVIYSVLYGGENIPDLVSAGVEMFNVSTGEQTPETIENIRRSFPDIPIMANGGRFNATIRETIRMGADAIVYSPPTATEMMRSIFDDFRKRRSSYQN